MIPPTLNDQILEIERTLRGVQRTYLDRVREKKLAQSVADHRIACLGAPLAELRKLKAFEEISQEMRSTKEQP